MSTKKIPLLGGLLAVLLSLSACASNTGDGTNEKPETGEGKSVEAGADAAELLPDDVREAGVLRLGSPVSNAPYIYYDEETAGAVGLIPELAKATGEELGVKIEIVETPFDGLIPALQADKIDAIWSLFNVSEERRQVVSFVEYVNSQRSFLVRSGNPSDVGALDENCGLTIAVLRGEAVLPMVEESSKKCVDSGNEPITIRAFDDAGAGRLQVQSGNVDAWLGNAVPLRFAAKEIDGGSTFEVVDYTFGEASFGIGYGKNDQEIGKALQQALVNLKEDGVYDEILESHGAEEDSLEADEMVIWE